MVEVVVTDEFREWYEALAEGIQDEVFKAVEHVKRQGTRLGFPQSSNIKSSRYAMRELRIQSHGDPYRVFYAFDPKRQAVLLIGACKAGIGDTRFYKAYVPQADRLWEIYGGNGR
jgi:hypothetical protein